MASPELEVDIDNQGLPEQQTEVQQHVDVRALKAELDLIRELNVDADFIPKSGRGHVYR